MLTDYLVDIFLVVGIIYFSLGVVSLSLDLFNLMAEFSLWRRVNKDDADFDDLHAQYEDVELNRLLKDKYSEDGHLGGR